MAKKALVSTIETDIKYVSSWETVDGEHIAVYTSIDNACRIAQVENAGSEFDVDGTVMYWVDCDDAVKADEYYYNLSTNTITAVPAGAAHPDDPA